HPAPHLGHPRRGIALPRVEGRPLGEEGTETVEVDELAELEAVAGSAAGQPTSEPSLTGPCRQQRNHAPPAAGRAQPRQVPKPQPIGASRETSARRGGWASRWSVWARAASIGLGPQA